MSQTVIELTENSSELRTAVTKPEAQRRNDAPHESSELPNDSAASSLAAAQLEDVPKMTTAFVMTSVTLITAVSTILAGLITVGTPQIAVEINLDQSLLLWPVSIYALVCGCTLLLFGSITDVVGSRMMYLVGSFLQACFTLGCGLAKTGTQMIVFRAFGGLAISMCLPSAVSIITNTFATGQRRNIAFASMGGGQPIGFAIGLTMGGVVTDTIGYQWGFYISAGITAALFVVAWFVVPKDEQDRQPLSWERLAKDIDWIGALTASSSLAGLSYVLASITASTHRISEPLTASIFAASLALIPAFIYWMHRQSSRGRPALIPNAFWRNKTFTAITVCVFLTWGSFNAIEQLLTFYYQYVQHDTALRSGLYFLPMPIAAIITNILMVPLVRRTKANKIVLLSTLISLAPGAIMAYASPQSSYWSAAFPSILLNPISGDCLYTIGNLVITDIFPRSTQALAGGVFNTTSQIGKSFALALSAVIANSVSAKAAAAVGQKEQNRKYDGGYPPEILMEGYRAAFWLCFALTAATFLVGAWGLRSAGKVGEKKEE